MHLKSLALGLSETFKVEAVEAVSMRSFLNMCSEVSLLSPSVKSCWCLVCGVSGSVLAIRIGATCVFMCGGREGEAEWGLRSERETLFFSS